MVPMADNLNHYQHDTNYDLVNIQEHMNPNLNSNYHTFLKMSNNYSTLFKHNNISGGDVDNLVMNGHNNQAIYEYINNTLSKKTILNQLRFTPDQIW